LGDGAGRSKRADAHKDSLARLADRRFSKKNPPLATGPQSREKRKDKSIRSGVVCRNSHMDRETH
jgi:hypothetical protein